MPSRDSRLARISHSYGRQRSPWWQSQSRGTTSPTTRARDRGTFTDTLAFLLPLSITLTRSHWGFALEALACRAGAGATTAFFTTARSSSAAPAAGTHTPARSTAAIIVPLVHAFIASPSIL